MKDCKKMLWAGFTNVRKTVEAEEEERKRKEKKKI